jgi:hypothetical protein
MGRQASVRCIYQPQQLRAIAIEIKTSAHQLQSHPSRRGGDPFSKRIGFSVGVYSALLGDHEYWYPNANDMAALKCFNLLQYE